MKSPLRKRIPRELRAEFGKYLVVLILMISTIGFVSGFLVADGSMIRPTMRVLRSTILKTGISGSRKNSPHPRKKISRPII